MEVSETWGSPEHVDLCSMGSLEHEGLWSMEVSGA